MACLFLREVGIHKMYMPKLQEITTERIDAAIVQLRDIKGRTIQFYQYHSEEQESNVGVRKDYYTLAELYLELARRFS